MKITITGRPGKIERHRNLVVTTMEDEIGERVNFPAGIPRPSAQPMAYTVYISSKQWERIAIALENPEDEMIVDGLCAFDDETGGIAVFSTYATTRRLQKKDKHQQKKSDASGAGKKSTASRRGKAPTEGRSALDEAHAPPPSPVLRLDLPPGVPEDVARKLHDLHTAAATFRQKLETILAQPEGQQYGLEMTQKLLTNTEMQIEELESQYTEES